MDGNELRLSDLPESILLHILSRLPAKEVVRSSVLCTRWRYLWKSVPMSLSFSISDVSGEKEFSDSVASINREFYYWRFCEKIATLEFIITTFKTSSVKDVDLLLHFATKVGNVEKCELWCTDYQFPQFAYESTSLRNLILIGCTLSHPVSINWSNLVSLTIACLGLTNAILEKVLCGCPNLVCLDIKYLRGIHHLQISTVKLRKLIINNSFKSKNEAVSLEIFTPNLQNMRLSGCFSEVHLKNVTSLVTAYFSLEERLEVDLNKLKGLLHSVSHVENLELGRWCIKCLSILELKGWKFPPSSRKFLKLNAALERCDFPGICSFLQSSSELETLVIDWSHVDSRKMLSKYTNRDEQSSGFEVYNFSCSLLHLKTVKIINFHGSSSGDTFLPSLVKYLLKNATVLEKFIIAARFEGSDVSLDYAKMEEEFLSFPRSSPRASIVLYH